MADLRVGPPMRLRRMEKGRYRGENEVSRVD